MLIVTLGGPLLAGLVWLRYWARRPSLRWIAGLLVGFFAVLFVGSRIGS